MQKIIVIGDVHGCFATLMELMKQFPSDAKVVFAGDLIDRGPRSREVVEFVKAGGYDCVKGNHEDLMVDAFKTKEKHWMEQCGGFQTLVSYSHSLINEHTWEIMSNYTSQIVDHLDWMKDLPVFLEFPDVKNDSGRHLVVSHSSVGSVFHWGEKKRKENKKWFEGNIMWDRNPPNDTPGVYNIFGHTPQETPRIKSFYTNIDTGCCFTGRDTYGVLSAIEFPSMKVYQQKNCEKIDE